MVIGIMVGSGIFRTPGLVATELGRPWLTFVAWAMGGVVGLLGAFVFAELATRHPQAGGKYVYAREAFGRRAAFTVGWIEAFGIYAAATAAIGVVAGEYVAQWVGLDAGSKQWLGAAIVALLTGVNLAGVAAGRWTQNITTAAKIAALAGVVVIGLAAGNGVGWKSSLPSAPSGVAVWGSLALAFQAVIWTYYGYPDAAKIAEEVVDPERTLPRIFLFGIGIVAVLYLLLNAAFLHVLPIDRIASSTLVAGDVAVEVFGPRVGTIVACLALLVVLASLNGTIFVTPRVLFGLARDGLAPRVLARVHRGGTPWVAMTVVGVVAVVLAATGTFEQLFKLAISLILLTDGFMVLVLFRLRARTPDAPFRVPLYPILPALFLGIYAVMFVAVTIAQPGLTGIALGALAITYGIGWITTR